LWTFARARQRLDFQAENPVATLLGEDQLARRGEPQAVGVAAVPDTQLAMAVQEGRAPVTGKSTTGLSGLVWPEAGSAVFGRKSIVCSTDICY
jgi:hypothetical protein